MLESPKSEKQKETRETLCIFPVWKFGFIIVKPHGQNRLKCRGSHFRMTSHTKETQSPDYITHLQKNKNIILRIAPERTIWINTEASSLHIKQIKLCKKKPNAIFAIDLR